MLATLDVDPVGSAIWELVDTAGGFSGTASELLSRLNAWVDADVRREPRWPRGANTLSRIISRIEPSLRQAGIGVERLKSPDRESRRIIRLARVAAGPLRIRKGAVPDATSSQRQATTPQQPAQAPRSAATLFGRLASRLQQGRTGR